MSSLPTHGRKKKLRRTGRHTSPSQVQKVAKRAGMAAPAVAVVGALAAAPHLRDHQATAHQATTSVASRMQSSAISDQIQVKAAHRPRSAQALATSSARPAAAASDGTDGGQTVVTLPDSTARQHKHAHKHHAGRHAAVRCSASSAAMLPANYATIVAFLTSHGYTGIGAAGIAGNMYQESGGNPESAGGLIGWTPLPAGLVTGSPAADLRAQLAAVLTFNDQYPQYIPELNQAATPAQAADAYMVHFERPGLPAAANREAAAQAVAHACGL